MVSLFFKIFYLFLSQSQTYREEERQRGRSFVHSFTPQVSATAGTMPIWSQEPGARNFLQVSHMRAGTQGFGLSSTVFPGHKQGAGWDAGLPGLELIPTQDPGGLKARKLTARLPHWAHTHILYSKQYPKYNA